MKADIQVNNYGQMKSSIYKGFLIIAFIEISIFLFFILATIYDLKTYKTYTGNVMFAPSLYAIIAMLRYLDIFHLVIIILSILPTICFYQYFIGSKSIYTIFRLPGKYSRLQFYINQVKVFIGAIAGFWLIQLLLIVIFYGIYMLVIPKESIVTDTDMWNNLWMQETIIKIYPFKNPKQFISLAFMPFILTNIGILFGLIERSRKRALLAIIGVIISLVGIYLYNGAYPQNVWIIPLVTVLSIAISIYYIYRIQIL